jgi:hypothetical protein
MAKAKKKLAKEPCNIFHNVVLESIKANPKPAKRK